jgi:hypothetical protein
LVTFFFIFEYTIKTTPMEIKGSAVKSIPDFVRKAHPEKYSAWIEALPGPSKTIFSSAILPSNWYSLKDAAIVPTEVMGQMFYESPGRGAWQCGRYSAEMALTGIYKFFIKAASPYFIIDRAGKIFSTYYQPSVMEVVEKAEDYVVLHITQFDEPSEVIEQRVAGWIERAMEIHGFGYVLVDVRKSMAHGDELTEFHVSWR